MIVILKKYSFLVKMSLQPSTSLVCSNLKPFSGNIVYPNKCCLHKVTDNQRQRQSMAMMKNDPTWNNTGLNYFRPHYKGHKYIKTLQVSNLPLLTEWGQRWQQTRAAATVHPCPTTCWMLESQPVTNYKQQSDFKHSTLFQFNGTWIS